MYDKVCQKRRRCAPPFLDNLEKTGGGGGLNNPPPAGRRLKRLFLAPQIAFGAVGLAPILSANRLFLPALQSLLSSLTKLERQIHDIVRETKHHKHFLLDLTCDVISDSEVNAISISTTAFTRLWNAG